ncbi:MAG: hypothetical protein GY862_18540, partial [Gammaproteobacteria bacterium]|nr:hypothetical protein [Gammaproteobacteria bacterium]
MFTRSKFTFAAILLVYLACSMAATVRADVDRWTALGPNAGEINVLAVNPVTPAILYAGTPGGVFKSENGAGNWDPVNTGLGVGSFVHALAMNPKEPAILYAGASDGLFKSTDAGRQWTDIGVSSAVFSLAINPQEPAILYAGTRQGIFKSANGGIDWTAVSSSGLTGAAVRALAIVPSAATILYAGTDTAGVFKSIDGGAAWTAVNTGLTETKVREIKIFPEQPDSLFVVTGKGNVFKSADAGNNWTAVDAGPFNRTIQGLAMAPPAMLYAATAKTVLRSADQGVTWFPAKTGLTGRFVKTLAVNPVLGTRGVVLYAGTARGGVFQSDDGGHNWDIRSNGLTGTDIRALAIDPVTRTTMYAGTLRGDLFRSTDGGNQWNLVYTTLGYGIVHDIVIDPAAPANVYAAGYKRVLKSNDGGRHWTAFEPGASGIYVQSLAVDNTALFAAAGNHIYKSDDEGNTWTALDTGLSLSGWGIYALAINPGASGEMYLGAYGDGVFKSIDAGNTWTAANTGLTNKNIFALAIDPPATLYAGTFGGAFKSTDSGATWTEASQLAGESVKSLVIAPDSPATLYAGTGSGHLFMSTDAGGSWTAIHDNLSPSSVNALAAVSAPMTIYAGTSLGVFSFGSPINQTPKLTHIGRQFVTLGNTLEFTALAEDADGNHLQFSLYNPPVGASIEPETGVFSFRPLRTGFFSLGVTVSETDGSPINLSAGETFGITVRGPQFPPSFLSARGSRGVGNGQFDAPSGLAVDSANNVYVSDTGNHRIQKFDSRGTFRLAWGISGSGDGEFNSPNYMAIDSEDNVYVADNGNSRIQKFDNTGAFLLKWGGPGTESGAFSARMGGIAVDSADHVYVSDYHNDRVQKFDDNGNFLFELKMHLPPGKRFAGPRGVALDSKDKIYVVAYDLNLIQKYDGEGDFLGDLKNLLSPPSIEAIAIDSLDRVYLTDSANKTVRKSYSNGEFILKWSGPVKDNGRFDAPLGIAVDNSRNIYVSDANAHRVQKFGIAFHRTFDLQTFGIDAAEIRGLDKNLVDVLDPEVFSIFRAANVADIPAEALSALTPRQFAKFGRDALAGLTAAQFRNIPPAVLNALTAKNAGGFLSEVIAELTAEHLNALDISEIHQVLPRHIAKVFTNMDCAKISPEDVQPLLPADWKIDLNSGALTAPPNTKLSYKALRRPADLPDRVKLPELPDLGSLFAVGGCGQEKGLLDDLNSSLAVAGFGAFKFSQRSDGVLAVTGPDGGISLAFIPDVRNLVQAGEDATAGVSVDENGRIIVTTEDKRQFPLIPAPHDLGKLSEIRGIEGNIKLGEGGDVLLSYQDLQSRQASFIPLAVIFDPFIEPAPAGVCMEISFGNVQCDWTSVPPPQQPGPHIFSPFFRKGLREGEEQSRIVYEDGTSQNIYASV